MIRFGKGCRRTLAAGCVLFGLAAGSAHAQIVLGQTTGLSGSQAAAVKETNLGAKLYFDAVNARGGVHGQPLQLVSLDDRQDPKVAADNARKLITANGAIALFMSRGTPQTEAIVPVLDELDTPLIAPTTGAMLLHSPVRKNVFNVRAPYQTEAAKVIRLLATIGITSVGVASVDDSFGADALQGALRGLANASFAPAFNLKFDKSATDFAALAQQCAASKAQAILVIGSGTTAANLMKAIRKAGSQAQLVTLSNNASAGFVTALGEVGPRVIVAQVFPNEHSIASPVVKEATRALRDSGGQALTPSLLEGYVAAKVLVEGLRRAGPKPTGSRLRKALETMRKFDVGGLELSFAADDHTGLEFVELSIIGKDGTFRR